MSDTLHPEVLWAQRSNETEDEKNIVYLSVNAIDLQHPKVDLKATSVVVEGVQRETNNVYKVSLEFFAEINVEASKWHATDRGVIFILRKAKKQAEFWPRLTKSAKKEHFIRTDFDKWVDEDEQDADANDPLSAYNFGSGGMPDMGDLDFSKLGGGAGAGGFGGDSSDDDDEDMPDLASDEPPAKEPTSTTTASEEMKE